MSPQYIIDDKESSSGSGEENSDEQILIKKFRMRKILIMKRILMR